MARRSRTYTTWYDQVAMIVQNAVGPGITPEQVATCIGYSFEDAYRLGFSARFTAKQLLGFYHPASKKDEWTCVSAKRI